MVFQYWHLAVVAALVALIVWGLRSARRNTLFGLAATLVLISGFLLYTLVLEERPYIEHEPQDFVWIGAPALLGVALLALAVKQGRSRRA